MIKTWAPNVNFWKISVRKTILRSRIFGTFVVKFIASLSLLGFSNIQKNGINNFIMIIETFNTAINAHLKLLSSSVTCASYDIC